MMCWRNWTFLAMLCLPTMVAANTAPPAEQPPSKQALPKQTTDSLQTAQTQSPSSTQSPVSTHSTDMSRLLKDCVDLYNQNEYQRAFAACSQASEQGDAQYLLGQLHHNGHGTHANYFKAIEWYQKAADKNHPEALLELGKAYSTGVIVPLDYQKAFHYFSKAAKQNIAQAKFLLAICYQTGLGTPMNFERASFWFAEAYENGYVVLSETEQREITQTASVIASNQDRTQDRALPMHETYLKAMQLIDSKNEDKRNLHLQLLNQAAAAGHPKAQFQLGSHYFHGNHLPQDDAKAYEWFSQSAAHQYAPAEGLLAWMHALGLGVKQNMEQAGYWFAQAQPSALTTAVKQSTAKLSDKDNPAMQPALAQTQTVTGIQAATVTQQPPTDPKRAFQWYQNAATQGDPLAQERVGNLYQAGKGVPQNFVEAYAWLNLATTNGSQKALSDREELAKRMTHAQISQAQQRSIQLYQQQIAGKTPITIQ